MQVLALLLVASCPLPSGDVRHPAIDVIVCVLDDVGVEALQATSTPTLDLLAAQGACYQRAYAMPVCSPSRYAMMFGRYPRRSGIGGTIDAIDRERTDAPDPERELVGLPEVFKANGYRTALIGKWHLGRAGLNEGIDWGAHVQGFDDWLAGLVNTTGELGDSNYDWRRTDDGVVTEHEALYTGDAQREAFVRWWLDHEGEPRFVWLAFAPPHAPFEPPPGQPDLLDDRGNFLQALTYVDGLLADCLGVVDLARTLVLVAGDNGTPSPARPQGGPPGRWKGTTFEGGVRVPLILHGPGVRSSRPDTITSLVDVPRLLFDHLSWPVPAGRFEDAVGHGGRAGSFLLVERFRDGLDDLALVEADWKYRRYDRDGAGPLPAVTGLYDLVSDPGERNLIALDDPAVTEVARRFQRHLVTLPARAP
jgi:arylsulfatase A-like enzyme